MDLSSLSDCDSVLEDKLACSSCLTKCGRGAVRLSWPLSLNADTFSKNSVLLL